MDLKKLNELLERLIEKKNELNAIDYNNEEYDDIEEELHDLEDDFNDEYGEYLEGILQSIHDEICPESDVLLPSAYLANTYIIEDGEGASSKVYDVKPDEGVMVEMEKYENRDTRLVILPSPLRVQLNIDKKRSEIVWNSEE